MSQPPTYIPMSGEKMYIQPQYAGAPPGNQMQGFAQIQDANVGYPQSFANPVPGQMMPQYTNPNPQMASINPQQMANQPFQQGVQPQVYYTATPVAALGVGAAPADCPACRTRAITRIDHVVGCTTHLWALIAFLFVGLPCIPYCIDSVKDVDHRCGNCGVLLATYKRSGGTIVHLHG